MPTLDLGSPSLAGTLTLSSPLSSRLLKLETPLDDVAAASTCAALERSLNSEVNAFCRRGASDEGQRLANDPPSTRVVVLRATADVLVVVTDHALHQLVGLFCRIPETARAAGARFAVVEPSTTAESADVVRAMLPRILTRAMIEGPAAAATRSWIGFGSAPRSGARLLHAARGSYFPTAPDGAVCVDALLLSPPVFIASELPNARVVIPSVTTVTTRLKRMSHPVAAMRCAGVAKEVIEATLRRGEDAQLCAVDDVSPLDDYGDDRADDDDGAAEPLLVTPAPILHKEARVVSFVFTPPAAYGHEDAAAFERAFSARHGLTDGVPPMIATTEDDDDGDDAADLSKMPPYAEISFCDDRDPRVRHLWPTSLLLTRTGATDVPAAMTAEKSMDLISRFAEDVRTSAFMGVRVTLDRVGGGNEDELNQQTADTADTAAAATTTKGKKKKGGGGSKKSAVAAAAVAAADAVAQPGVATYAITNCDLFHTATSLPGDAGKKTLELINAAAAALSVRVEDPAEDETPMKPPPPPRKQTGPPRTVALAGFAKREAAARSPSPPAPPPSPRANDGTATTITPPPPPQPEQVTKPKPRAPVMATHAPPPPAVAATTAAGGRPSPPAVVVAPETLSPGVIAAAPAMARAPVFAKASAPAPAPTPTPAETDAEDDGDMTAEIYAMFMAENDAGNEDAAKIAADAAAMPPPAPKPRAPAVMKPFGGASAAAAAAPRPALSKSKPAAGVVAAADGTAGAEKPKKAPRKRKVIDPELNDAAVRKRFKDEGADAVAKFPGDELIAFLKKAGAKGNFGKMKKDELVGKAKEVLASAAVVA